MTKLLIIAFAVVAVVWLLRRAIAGRGADRKAGPEAGGGAQQGDAQAGPDSDLVSCAHCGVNLPKLEAYAARGVQPGAGGRHYCSEEHWRAGPRDG
jgi:hypothetical protein